MTCAIQRTTHLAAIQRDKLSFLLHLDRTTKGTSYHFNCNSIGQPKGQPIFSIATQWNNLSFLLQLNGTAKEQPIFSIATHWDNRGATYPFYCNSMGQPKWEPIFSIAIYLYGKSKDLICFLLFMGDIFPEHLHMTFNF